MSAVTPFIATLVCLCFSLTVAYYGPESRDEVIEGTRNKRYTDYQERASAFCTGMCMYQERKTYSDCFDLCNWTGQGQNPWAKLDKGKTAATAPAETSVESMSSLMRTGSRGKPRTSKSGIKKANSWGY